MITRDGQGRVLALAGEEQLNLESLRFSTSGDWLAMPDAD